MGEAIKGVIANYAACVFLGGILELASSARIKSTLRVIIALSLIFSVAAPLADKDFSLELSEINNREQVETDALMSTAGLIERKIKANLKAILINENIDEYEIYVETDVDKEEGVVYLDRVEVLLPEKFINKKDLIVKAVEQDYKSVLKVGVKNE